MANDERDTTKIDDQAHRLRRMRRNMEYGDEMHEIVRRLAEWDKKYPKGTIHSFNAEKEHDAIAADAAKLWAKMQEEAKGGDQ